MYFFQKLARILPKTYCYLTLITTPFDLIKLFIILKLLTYYSQCRKNVTEALHTL